MILLGSTGSIGVNALSIARDFKLKVTALCANTNVKLLNQQIEEFKPLYVAIGDENLKDKINHDKVFTCKNGIIDMLNIAKDNLVVNALVGFAGLSPTIKSIKLGKHVALANKESLVVAGNLIDTSKITPIDSEHFGLKYLLNDKKVKNMTITASGGAFRDIPLEKIPHLKLKDALKHPNWSMGTKITIDSATMINKLFELLEAKWLFNAQKYDAIIEPKSLIHAFIDFIDGSTTAHFANADMKLPIAYALLGKIEKQILPHVNLQEISNLEFRQIDPKRYPIWEIKDEVLSNPSLGVIINAANEVAIEKFIKEEINTIGIVNLIQKALKEFSHTLPTTLEEIYEIDLHVREFCLKG